jgi:hypothetical protein
MKLVKHEDIPKKVFLGVFILLLAFFSVGAFKNATVEKVRNSGDCPTRFDALMFFAILVLMACISSGIASLAYLGSKLMVKKIWPKTDF